MIILKSLQGLFTGMPINVLSGCQARAGRAMLGWSVNALADKSGVSASTIRRIEATYGTPEKISLDRLIKLQGFFEKRGFSFAFDDPRGHGIFWRRKERRRGPPPISEGGNGSAEGTAD